MKAGLWEAIRAAFSARPIGMLVPPNWIGIGLFAMLGLLNPGFWIVGAGLELAYLYVLSTNPRFRNYVQGTKLLAERRAWQARLARTVERLGDADRREYQQLEARCRAILVEQGGEEPAALRAQGEGLGRLLWITLRLLLTRQAIRQVLADAARERGADSIETRADRLRERIAKEGIAEDLRKSLAGQLEIIEKRMAQQREAAEKLAFLESELARVREQVELIREQAVLATDPETVSQRIDEIAATLGGTTQWIREQQQIYGQVEDLLAEPLPLDPAEGEKESS